MATAGKKRPAPPSGGPTKRAKTSAGDSKLKFKSPAEFFAENKNIAGFDNPGKSLYTTVRELVENALDAAEALPALPEISVSIRRISTANFRKMVGADNRERVDETLYKDVETAKERKAREAREKREAKKRAKAAESSQPSASQSQTAASQSMSQPTDGPPVRKGGSTETFCVTVRDNGTGMAHDDVPNMMGRVLAGTKYCVRQSRGKFGLGSKMALIWSKMSTGLPVHVKTARRGQEITECVLDIDIAQNKPNVIRHVRVPNTERWNGTEVSVTIAGNWKTYRAKILLYMRQMAVITPYAQFRLGFDFGDKADASRNFDLIFSRRTDQMPAAAKEVKHHPSSVNQLLLKQLIADVRPTTSLVHFLSSQFVCIPRSLASRLINELGSGFTTGMHVEELGLNHIRQLNALLHEARFDRPDGECLSPAGEYNLRLGITKELRPKMVATHAESPDVFEGHPFIVEVGVALGCSGMKPGINVFRFANRIPLLFEAGSDVVTKTVKEDIRWSNYKISAQTDHIGVICSIVSTRIPFKGTGKEYIGDDSDAIKAAVKRGITQCCLQLKTKLVRKAAQKDAAERKKTIVRYAPDVANAIYKVFDELKGMDPTDETRDVCEQVGTGVVTKEILEKKLVEHVEHIDRAQALEYVAATGRDHKTLETVFIAPRRAGAKLVGCELPDAPNGAGPALSRAASASSSQDKGESSAGVRMVLLESAQSVI